MTTPFGKSRSKLGSNTGAKYTENGLKIGWQWEGTNTPRRVKSSVNKWQNNLVRRTVGRQLLSFLKNQNNTHAKGMTRANTKTQRVLVIPRLDQRHRNNNVYMTKPSRKNYYCGEKIRGIGFLRSEWKTEIQKLNNKLPVQQANISMACATILQ